MTNILLLSSNDFFANDLCEQIERMNEGFSVVRHQEDNFDIALIDEDVSLLKTVDAKVPLFLFTSDEKMSTLENVHVFVKPFRLAELLDSLHSCINRFENSAEGFLRFGTYELQPAAKDIINLKTGESIKLTEKEVAIIKHLYKASPNITSKNELLQEVWGYSPEASTHTIETHIYRLRQKVEHGDDSAQLIMTEDGGYLLNI